MIAHLLAAMVALAPGGRRPIRHVVPVDGFSLTVWEKRPTHPRGAILLLHGRTWSSLPDFDLQVPGEHLSMMDALVARGYEVFALDARGYGATPRDSTGWLTPFRAAQDAAGVLQWIAKQSPTLPRPVLFGWSRGSVIAHLVAQLQPDAMSALVLFGYPTVRPSIGDSALVTPPRIKNTEAGAAEDFITPGSISQAAIHAYVAAALAADPVRVDWRRSFEFEALDPGSVTVPTLVIHGERDPLYSEHREAQAYWFSQLGTRDKAWVILPHADHAALLETAGPRLIQAMVGFIERPRVPMTAADSAADQRSLTTQWDTVFSLSESKAPPLSVLFIGNSYTYFNNLPRLLGALSRAPDSPRPVVAGMVVTGGARLEDLWSDGGARAAIKSRHWDYVVLQEQSTLGSQSPRVADPANFYKFARLFDQEIKTAGAQTVFYMTWARRTDPESQTALSNAYRHIASELHAVLAPVGEAWATVEHETPAIDLHQRDNSHPTPAGSYLAACVFYATLLHANPAGLPGTISGTPVDIAGRLIEVDNGGSELEIPSALSVDLVHLDDATARTLQRAAWASGTR